MRDDILLLIGAYLAAVEEAVSALQAHLGTPSVLLKVRQNPELRRGRIDVRTSYQFHGIGCRVETNGKALEFDFLPYGKLGGFDVWRLSYFAQEIAPEFPQLKNEREVETLLTNLANDGLIKPETDWHLFVLTDKGKRLIADLKKAGQLISTSTDGHSRVGCIIIRCETGDELEIAGTTLVGAELAGLNLHRALLEMQDMRGANLSGADLRSAWLDGARLDGANLTRAKMSTCSASSASFVGVNFAGAFMRSAGFEEADFTGASLLAADVGGAQFTGAIFVGADLRASDLDEANLTGAIADSSTKWPEHFEPLDHGVVIR